MGNVFVKCFMKNKCKGERKGMNNSKGVELLQDTSNDLNDDQTSRQQMTIEEIRSITSKIKVSLVDTFLKSKY
jgi:hypothetical protein